MPTIAGSDVMTASAHTLGRLRRASVAVVLQRPTQKLCSHLTVTEPIELGARRRDASGTDVDRAIESMSLTRRRRARPATLFGGEQQRLAIAMATIGAPALVLADEPTAELNTLVAWPSSSCSAQAPPTAPLWSSTPTTHQLGLPPTAS